MKTLFLLILVFCSIMNNVIAQSNLVRKADFIGGNRSRGVAFVAGNKFYYGTGNTTTSMLNDMYCYNPATNTWVQIANLPKGVQAGIGFNIGNKGYAGCGWGSSGPFSDFYEYDPTTNLWTSKASFTGSLINDAVGFSINNLGYIACGSGVANSLSNQFYEYSPSTNKWTQKTNFQGSARRNLFGGSTGNIGYVGCGSNGSTPYSSCYKYDQTSNMWSGIADFPFPVEARNSTFVIDNVLYIALANQMWTYKSKYNKWFQVADYPTTNGFDGVGVINGKAYLYETNSNRLWEFTPPKSNFITTFPNSGISNNSCMMLTADTIANSYLWSTGETTKTITVCKSQTFSVTVTFSDNSKDSSSIGVLISKNNDSIVAPNGEIYSINRNGNTIYIGGDFNYVGATSGNGAVIDNVTGNFNHQTPRVNGTIYTTISDGQGGWYIGGNFTKVGIYSCLNIAHIKSDNTVDLGFSSSANGTVETLYLAGSNLFAAGSFTHIGDVNRNYIAILNKTTGMGTSWDAMADGKVRTLTMYNGNLYVGGDFTNIGSMARNYLACIDTVYAQATTWNPNPNNKVNKVVASGIKLYVAGDFTLIGATTKNYLCSFTLTTGNLDTWNPSPNAKVYDVLVNGSTIYTAGAFTNIGTQTRNYIASITNTSGTANTWTANANDTVFSIALSNGNLIAGGRFTTIAGVSRNCLASISTSTGVATAWNPNINGLKGTVPYVKTLATYNNSIYAGGSFYSLGGQTRNNIAAIDATTGGLLSWNANANGIVRSIYPLGNFVYIGGDFTQVGAGIIKNHIAQLKVADAVPAGWNPNANGNVHSITSKGNNLYVGGEFATIGGNARPKLAIIYIADGTSPTWAPTPNGTVRTVTISGDTLYAGGEFTTIGGQTRNRIASYNLTSQNITAFNPDANGIVYSISVKNNKAYIGGAFTTINGQARNNFASCDVKNNLITSVSPIYIASNSIYSVASSDSSVYIGGKYNYQISKYDYSVINATAIKTSTGVVSDYWHPQPDDIVRSIFIYQDKIYLGGKFQHILSNYQPFFAEVDNYFTGQAEIKKPTITQFCEGDIVPLNASKAPGYKYQWYLNDVLIPNADSCSYIPKVTGDYQAEIRDTINYGSLFTNSVHVDVDLLPDTIITPSGPTQFCGVGIVILNAVSKTGYSYQWYKDGNVLNSENSSSYTATTNGEYYCDVYNASGCPKSSQKITVNTSSLIPIVTASGTLTLCSGDSITLTSDQTTNNVWYKNSVATTETNQTITITDAGDYKVYSTNNGCSGYSSIKTVTVNPLPTADAGLDKSICKGYSTNLTATGGGTYKWNNGLTIPTFTDTPSLRKVYTVTVTNEFNCSASDSTVVTVNPKPLADAGVNQSICKGTTTALTATGGATYSWSNSAGNTDIVNVSPTSSTTYTVSVWSEFNCSATDFMIVTVTPLPTANAGTDKSICIGYSASLSATGGTLFDWSESAGNTASVTVTPSISTTYIVTVKDANNCSATDNIIVNVNQLPIVSAGSDVVICQGVLTTLTASGGNTYKWNNSAGNTAIVSVSPSSALTYTVTVTDVNSCSNTEDVVVSVNLKPTASAGADQDICKGNSASLSASGGETYTWNNSAGSTDIVSVSPTATTTYIVTVKDLNNCTASDNVVVNVNLLPAINLGADKSICIGNSTTLSANVGTVFNWSDGLGTASSITITPITIKTYSVTVTDANNCSASDNIIINVNLLPIVSAGSDVEICQGTSTSLSASGGSVYKWSNSAGNTAIVSVSPSNTTTYSVTVTDVNNCSNTDEIIVAVKQTPTVPIITQKNDSLISDAFNGNQWYEETTGLISSAIESFYKPIATGSYYVIVSENGCSSNKSNVLYYGFVGLEQLNKHNSNPVYPNPVTNRLNISFDNYQGNSFIQIYDAIGQIIISQVRTFENKAVETIDFSEMSAGVYYLRVQTQNKTLINKIVKQ